MAETREDLMAELATRQDVTMDQVLAVGRMSDGTLVWLEEGNLEAGFRHIIQEHADDFLRKTGIAAEQLPKFLIRVLQNGRVVATQGRDRKVFQVQYDGQVISVAISLGSNGFISGANPVGERTLRKLLRRRDA